MLNVFRFEHWIPDDSVCITHFVARSVCHYVSLLRSYVKMSNLIVHFLPWYIAK